MSKDRGPDLGGLILAGEGVGAAIEIAPGIWMSPGISNSYRVTTPEGDLQINAGMFFEGAVAAERYAAVSSGPVRVMAFTQSHPDHIGGAAALAGPRTQIVVQANYAEVRGYWNRLGEFYARRSQVLWKRILGDRGQMPEQPPDPVPDILFDDHHTFELGGRRFELLATPGGETTDSLVVWLPEEKIVFTGNLFGPIFGHLPNLYTIRGDKIRSAMRFIDSLDRVRGLGAELLVTGHGEPIAGREEIDAVLARVREATLWIHDRTVEGMNAGRELWELMQDIALPEGLALGQGHGKTPWCVRAVFEEYAGWFRYESTAELYEVPPRAIWKDVVLEAGPAGLVERASAHLRAGRPVEALHLSDMVLHAVPGQVEALGVRIGALEQLLERAGGENFSEVMWLEGRLAEARETLAATEEKT